MAAAPARPAPLLSRRVPGHAEPPGPVHLHRRPAAAALRRLPHRGAGGVHHHPLRPGLHRLSARRLPEGEVTRAAPALPRGAAKGGRAGAGAQRGAAGRAASAPAAEALPGPAAERASPPQPRACSLTPRVALTSPPCAPGTGASKDLNLRRGALC